MTKILVALLAGIAIGVLIAPAKGAETREKIKEGFNGLADNLSDLKDKILPSEEKRVWERAFGDKKLAATFDNEKLLLINYLK